LATVLPLHRRSDRREALRKSGRLNDNFELTQGYFARGIEQRLPAASAYVVDLPSTKSIPEKSNSNLGRGSLLTRSLRRDLSREMICETLATESFGNPVTLADKLTLPGASAHFRLLVSGTQIAVEMRL
jgi:hypothetical protein